MSGFLGEEIAAGNVKWEVHDDREFEIDGE
jgi:hypothetical protein